MKYKGIVRSTVFPLMLFILMFPFVALAQLEQPSPPPVELSKPTKDKLNHTRLLILKSLDELRGQIGVHNRRCSSVPDTDTALIADCGQSRETLSQKINSYRNELANYEQTLRTEIRNAQALASQDPMVVDARVPPMGASLLAQVPELERSPAADRIRRGFQAVMTVPRDWPVALAWWQEALQRDPNNKALIRSVDLAQWMVDSKKRAASRQIASSYAAIDAFIKSEIDDDMRGYATEIIEIVEQANKKNAIQEADAERMKNRINQEVKQRIAAKEAPKPSPTTASMTQMAAEGDRALSERMFEDGLQFLVMGDYKHAEEMFRQAEFQRNLDGGKQ